MKRLVVEGPAGPSFWAWASPNATTFGPFATSFAMASSAVANDSHGIPSQGSFVLALALGATAAADPDGALDDTGSGIGAGGVLQATTHVPRTKSGATLRENMAAS